MHLVYVSNNKEENVVYLVRYFQINVMSISMPFAQTITWEINKSRSQ